jgi:hypothetical protein
MKFVWEITVWTALYEMYSRSIALLTTLFQKGMRRSGVSRLNMAITVVRLSYSFA